jgi:hypothetical protein
MLNQNVNLAGMALTPEEQARMARAQAMQDAGAEPIQVQSYKGIQAPVSGGEAIAKVLQSYMGARQKDAILNRVMGNTGISVGDTNQIGKNPLEFATRSQASKFIPKDNAPENTPHWSETSTAKGAFQNAVDFDKMRARYTLQNDFLGKK